MAVQAIIFDIGGVLIQEMDLDLAGEWNVRFGFKPGELTQRFIASGVPRLALTGELSRQEAWKRIGAFLSFTDEQLREYESKLWSQCFCMLIWPIFSKVFALTTKQRLLVMIGKVRERRTTAVSGWPMPFRSISWYTLPIGASLVGSLIPQTCPLFRPHLKHNSAASMAASHHHLSIGGRKDDLTVQKKRNSLYKRPEPAREARNASVQRLHKTMSRMYLTKHLLLAHEIYAIVSL